MGVVKYLLYIFNLIFVLLGSAILGIGIYVTVSIGRIKQVGDISSSPAIGFICVGAIVFVIAFFGCWGARTGSSCMLITYAVLLLAILLIQVALGIYVIVLGNKVETKKQQENLATTYEKIFEKYWTDDPDRYTIDTVQSALSCCGKTGASDFEEFSNKTIPWSCCGFDLKAHCTEATAFKTGCLTKVMKTLKYLLNMIGAVGLVVAAAELVGIALALLLANFYR